MNSKSVTLFLTGILALVSVGLARDPNYATVVRFQENDGSDHQYRLVSLNWLDYFARSTDDPLNIYYTVQSLPEEITVRDARTGTFERYRNNGRERLVRLVFEHVLDSYVRKLLQLKKRVNVYVNSVDQSGVPVNNGRNWFNRTIVISFEDPPYGQSRPNRLVTNRNIPWTIWTEQNNDLIRYNRRVGHLYNQTEDLIYRYFHNVGHSLGFGHYLGSSKNGRDVARRSVMYPNYKDLRYSASSPFSDRIDVYAMSRLAADYEKYLLESAKNVSLKLSDSLEDLMHVSVAMV